MQNLERLEKGKYIGYLPDIFGKIQHSFMKKKLNKLRIENIFS